MSSTTNSTFHQLDSLGLVVFPIKKGDKRPLGSWKPFQNQRPTPDMLNRWAENDTNVGIVTGKHSGLLVLDLDTEDAVAEAMAMGIPATPTVSTGKGLHVYFQYPNGEFPNRAGFKPGWDIRGEGGYVVGAGSLHPSGKNYTWANFPTPFALAPVPDWLMSLLNPPKPLTELAQDKKLILPIKGNAPSTDHPYAMAVVKRACEAIGAASCGEQEVVLNAAAFKVGQYVGSSALTMHTAQHLLLQAALGMPNHDSSDPWTRFNLIKKIEDALVAGQSKPKPVPPRTKSRGKAASDQDAKGPSGKNQSGVEIDDFRAYMPTHQYIFMPTGDLWPAASVNDRLDSVPLLTSEGTPVLNKKGEPVTKSAGKWLAENRAVEQMVWAPGLEPVIKDRIASEGGWIQRLGCNVFNKYRPPVSIDGNAAMAQPWLDHIYRLYGETDASHIVHWLAYKVQHPGDKINHALVLGGSQGIGKDFILEGPKAAVGAWNFAEVSQEQVVGRFNAFAKSVILRVNEARDLGDVNGRAFYNHMKTYTAAPPDVLLVDEKHKSEHYVFNVCGVIITTNHKTDGIYLPPDDRRHYVAWSTLKSDNFSQGYWDTLWSWYASEGLGHIATYLRTLCLADFNAKAPPPKTEAFWNIVGANAAPEDADLADALDKLGRPRATTIGELVAVASDDLKEFLSDRRNSRQIAHRLDQCGYVANRNNAVKDGLHKLDGKRCVIYVQSGLSREEKLDAAAQRLKKPKAGQ